MDRMEISRRTFVGTAATLAAGVLLALAGCGNGGSSSAAAGAGAESAASAVFASTSEDPSIDASGQTYDGFELDDIFRAPSGASVHFSARVPEPIGAGTPQALFVTLPGWEGLRFQGVGENLRQERFAQEAAARDPAMIVLAPQLDDWGQTSADRTIELVEHFVANYNVDPSRVYIEGYSGGGETLSLVMGKRPELFAGALAVSSQWDGSLDVLADAHTPLRLFTGRDDSYYGSDSFVETAEGLRELYRRSGKSEQEIDSLVVLDIKEAAYFAEHGYADQHGGGMAAAADPEALPWLFAQRKGEL